MVFNDVILEDCNGKVYVCTFLREPSEFQGLLGVSILVEYS